MTNGANEVVVRDAEPGDTKTVAHIWHQGWRDGHLGHVPDGLVDLRTAESFEQRAAARVDGTRVAVVRDEVAGFVMVATMSSSRSTCRRSTAAPGWPMR